MDLSSIAVVILNWNGRKLLEGFLPSVTRYSGNAAIYLADNASTDDSVSFVKANFPSVKIIINEVNGGYAKGYNDALKSIEEPYYLLLNSDIEVTENWLSPLLEIIQQQNVGAVQPKIKAFSEKESFEYAGAAGGFIDKDFYPFCRGRIFDNVEKDSGQYDYPMEVFWASGACMLIRRSLFWETGGLDEDFFAHMEEIDLCWRIKKRGYSMQIIPQSVVYHVGGGTLSYASPQKTFLNFRNSLLMITKNYNGWLSGKILRRLVLDGIAGIVFLVKGNPRLTWAVIRAHFAYYSLLGKMLKKREKESFLKFKEIKGVYSGSILWAVHIHGIRKFSDLNYRKLERY
ncbi:MAG: glycosyltransferase family 2 protein [Flavobacteriia bacterium]|nr:glycosyltransferase family 2 protein [Flavobacteriia bacterium]OJX39406.1 MAG: hypothetical protein BGO87_05385 [Flavobacteriia bacterium 40-80]